MDSSVTTSPDVSKVTGWYNQNPSNNDQKTPLYPYNFESYCQWLALTCFLSSVSAVIANTGHDAALATLFDVTGLAILIWSTPYYFIDRWATADRGMMIGLIIIVLLLASCCVWTLVHVNSDRSSSSSSSYLSSSKKVTI
jgi:MFS superfamily sulfate permease-like transporter